jgi:hypothetical protein
VAEAPEAWGTMPIEGLMGLLEETTEKLIVQHQEVAVDEGQYNRKFWTTWQQLPDGMTIAAMNRECEMACKELREMVILGESVREGLVAKRDALVAILHARTK